MPIPDDLEEKQLITYCVLDRALFPNGTAYFNAKLPQKLGIVPYIVHNNCIIGYIGKVDRFKLFNMWYLEEENLQVADEVPEHEPLVVKKGHIEIINTIKVYNDKVYSASHDKTIRIWSLVY